MQLYKEATEEEIEKILESCKDRLLRVLNGREDDFIEMHNKGKYETALAIGIKSLQAGYTHIYQSYKTACIAKDMIQQGEKVYAEIK